MEDGVCEESKLEQIWSLEYSKAESFTSTLGP